MKQYERMLEGKLYSIDEKISSLKTKARDLIWKFNQTKNSEQSYRQELLVELLGEMGENTTIKPPFYCSHGKHIKVGKNFFCNFNCIFLDLNYIFIGDNVMIGPCVRNYTASLPIDAKIRNTGLEYALPVIIEDDVWIAGDVVINPGITIGKGTIIGSGSVVTKDIPANSIAFGNPCCVKRTITEEDAEYWTQQKLDYLHDND